MPFAFGGTGTGGSGFSLGPVQNEFATNAARDTYATANATWLAQYNGNRAFWIRVGGAAGEIQRRNSAGTGWEVVTGIVSGRAGADSTVAGPAGPGVPDAGAEHDVLRKATATDQDTEWFTAPWRTAAQVTAAIVSYGYQTAAQVTTAITGYGYQTATQVQTAVDAATTALRDGVSASFDTLAELAAGLAERARLDGATFTGSVSGITPTADAHFATKAYVDSAVGSGGGTPVVMDDLYFGTSDDDTPEASELSIMGSGGEGIIAAYAGHKHHLIARLASEGDITSVVYSDDPSMDNAIGAFTKWGATLTPPGETVAYSVWITNQALSNAADVTLTVG